MTQVSHQRRKYDFVPRRGKNSQTAADIFHTHNYNQEADIDAFLPGGGSFFCLILHDVNVKLDSACLVSHTNYCLLYLQPLRCHWKGIDH